MPRPVIDIDGLVLFDGTGDVLLTPKGVVGATAEPERLLEALRLAAEHRNNPHLIEGMRGKGLLANRDQLSFEEFLVLIEEAATYQRQTAGARAAKVQALKARRSQFSSNKAALMLQMLDAGIRYACAHPGCLVAENLTVDHIIPVSRGGTDEIENLQFMCLPHNAAKGNRV
jgi:hypothetical protein